MTKPWSVLEIEPTEDLRSIKRAYAKKLKETRPDEDNAGFQELHECYKWALDLAEMGDVFEEDEPADEICLDDAEFLDLDDQVERIRAQEMGLIPGDEEQETLPDQQPVDVEPDYDVSAVASVVDQANAVLSVDADPNDLAKWHFLQTDENWFSDAFRSHAGDEILKLVLAHQEKCESAIYARWRLTENTLTFLDAHCGWRNRFWELASEFGYEEMGFLHELPDRAPQYRPISGGIKGGAGLEVSHQKPNMITSYRRSQPVARAFAMVIDMVVSFIPYVLIFTLLRSIVLIGKEVGGPLALLAAGVETGLNALESAGLFSELFLVYLCVSGFVEGTNWSASPGKKILGIRVVQMDGSSLEWCHSIIRSMSLAAVLLLAIGLNTMLGQPVSDLTMIMVPFIACNWLAGGRYPHDPLSGTMVLSRVKEEI